MTSEEGLDRIEHVTAGLAEERRKDREEYKALWRENHQRWLQTQDLVHKIGHGLIDLQRQMAELASETNLQIREYAAESRAADERLGARIDALVSAIGGHIGDGHPEHRRAIEQLAQRVAALEQQSRPQ